MEKLVSLLISAAGVFAIIFYGKNFLNNPKTTKLKFAIFLSISWCFLTFFIMIIFSNSLREDLFIGFILFVINLVSSFGISYLSFDFVKTKVLELEKKDVEQ